MIPDKRRAYASSHKPYDFLHLLSDIDYDIPPWQQDPLEQARHLQLHHDPDAADTITSDSSADPSPTSALSVTTQPTQVPTPSVINLTPRHEPADAFPWYPTRFIHFRNRLRLQSFRGPVCSIAFRIRALLRLRQSPLSNESSPWEPVDSSYGLMTDLID